MDQQTRLGLPNSPRHVARARLSLPGPLPRSIVSVEGGYLSGRTTVVGSRLSGRAIFNVHVIQPLGRSWELFGGFRNALSTRYSDPVSGQHMQEAIEQNGRTARSGLRWKLWQP